MKTQTDVYNLYYHHIENKFVLSFNELISTPESTLELKKYGEYNDINYRLKSERISHYNNVNLTFHGVYYPFYKNKILWDCNNATLLSTNYLAQCSVDNIKIIETPIYFIEYSWGMCNYTHFLTEVLPRFLHYLQLKHYIPDLKLFFKSINTIKNIECILDILNILNEDVIMYDEKLDNSPYLIKNFYISNTFDPSITLDTNNLFFTDTHYQIYEKITTSVMKKINDQIYQISPELKNLDKIYFSRNNIGTRKLKNENEYYNHLKNLGYVKICPENYNFIENIYIVMTAKIIIAEHGSALSNLFFAVRKDLNVICFGHPFENINLLWSLMGKRYGFKFYEKNDCGKLVDDQEFNTKYINISYEIKQKINPWNINIDDAINFIKLNI
jgi:hypothetical protein